MSKLSSRLSAKKKGKIVALVLSIMLVLVGCAIITFSFLREKSTEETPTLTILSCDNRVYYGGDFKIEAAYKYRDGHVEYSSSENKITYESEETILSIDPDGKIQVVEDIYGGETEYKEHPVKISVKSQNKKIEAIQVSVNVVPVYEYNITKYYYDNDTLGLESESLPAWGGQSVEEIATPILDNYLFENWYVEKIGDEALSEPIVFHAEDKYYWGSNISIKPRFYANLQLNTDGVSTEDETSPVKIYFNEPLHEKLSTLTSNEDWEFSGWYSEVGGNGNRYFGEGEIFKESIPTLYAKWTSSLRLDSVFPSGIDDNINVTYHSNLNLPKPVYHNGGIFMNWYLADDGKETMVSSGEIYCNRANATLTAKVKFPISFDYQGATDNTKGEEYFAIYDDSLSSMGWELPHPENNTESGWLFEGWYTQPGGKGEEFTAQSVLQEGGVLTLYAKRTSTFKLYRQLNESGEVTDSYENIDLVYNTSLEIPTELTAGGWTYGGFYSQKDGGGENIISQNSYVGAGQKTFFAKWTKQLTLITNDVTTDAESSTKVPVTFNACSAEFANVRPQYSKGGEFDGWFSQPNGDGTEVNPQQEFVYTDGDTLFNKVIFSVIMDPYNGLEESTVSYSGQSDFEIVYGKTLSEQFNTAFVQPISDKWDFNMWYLLVDGSEVSVDESMDIPLNGTNVIGKVATDRDGNIKVLAKWSCRVVAYNKLDAQNDRLALGEFIAYNNTAIDISQSSWGDWSFIGWCANREDLTDNGFPLLENEYRGIGNTTIYAKWTCTSYLRYQNDGNTQETMSFIYGVQNENLPSRITDSTKFGSKRGYEDFIAWSADKGDTYKTYYNSPSVVDKNTTSYPKVMNSLYAVWQPRKFKVNLFDIDTKGQKGDNLGMVEVYAGDLIQGAKLPPVDPNKTFSGYFYSDGTRYIDSTGNGSHAWDLYDAETSELLAKYNYDEKVIKLDKQSGVGGVSELAVTLNAKLPSPITSLPSRVGYIFKGYYSETNGSGELYYDEMGECQKNGNWNGTITILYAHWIEYPIKITSVDQMTNVKGSKNIQVSVDFANDSGYSYSVTDNDGHLNISAGSGSNINSATFKFSISRKDGDSHKSKNGTVRITVTDINSQKSFSNNYNYTTDGGCFVAGTLITMGDGTQKKIEDIHVGDMVLSWNFMTGQAEEVPVGQYYKLQDEAADLLSLRFSDGTKIDIVYCHGFFDFTLNEFVFIDSVNYYEYIGHEFVKYEDGAVNTATLLSVEHSVEDREFYAIVTACNYNAFAEGFMSLTKPFVDGIYTYFEVGDNLMYDMDKMQEDIDTYGLYTYEEALSIIQSWGFEVFPYEYFVAVNVQYYKILLGKGIVTYDDIIFLINEMISHS